MQNIGCYLSHSVLAAITKYPELGGLNISYWLLKDLEAVDAHDLGANQFSFWLRGPLARGWPYSSVSPWEGGDQGMEKRGRDVEMELDNSVLFLFTNLILGDFTFMNSSKPKSTPKDPCLLIPCIGN